MKKLYTLGLYEKALPVDLSWEEKLKVAKESGYDFLEMSIDETEEKMARLDMSEIERLQLFCTAKKVGLPIRSLCLSCHRKYPFGSKSVMTRNKALELMEKAVVLAEGLGICQIQLAGYDVFYEESDEQTKQYFLKNIKKAAEIAARSGVLLGFETMDTECMDTVEKALFYINQVRSPYMQIYPDLGNLANTAVRDHTDMWEDLKKGEGRIVALHLKETLPGIYRNVPFGKEHVDFEKGIQLTWNMGVRRFVTEFWDTGKKDWADDVVDAADRMRKILDRQR